MTKVLVVDDSALMRRLLTGLLRDNGFEVATARNGAEGVQQLTDWQPDVVTLDINMPEMDGLTALSLMMQARPTPVVMVSSLTEKGAQATFEALALGAVDFIAKPGGTISLSVDDIAGQLLAKVKAAARARMRSGKVVTRPALPAPVAPVPAPAPRPAIRTGAGSSAAHLAGLVLVGVSTGGPRTLEDILPQLPADFPWPVVVAQHMPPNFTDAFARRMDSLCRLRVQECAATVPLEAGKVYIGKGGTDIVICERLGRLAVQPRPETPGHPWHPSVDVMVDSAMKLLPADRIVGVQLTGMGNDGATAMTALKRAGGRTIAESKETAVVFGMPAELIEAGGASVVLPCQDIARQIIAWSQRRPHCAAA
ncbi:chemotaxis-specific protein-glutamate methyltransferase CheB [Pseudaquabacterium rugosum]|uniref:Protein-glutamate methylesterase/protein-glutamine glutaminase n=1 Tax=Pseudaquabacterium rugosum TaxID=2984194 RepID=A0ABU9BHP8_9BURK